MIAIPGNDGRRREAAIIVPTIIHKRLSLGLTYSEKDEVDEEGTAVDVREKVVLKMSRA